MKTKSLKLNALLNGVRITLSMIFPLITFPYVSRILQVDNLGKVNFGDSIVSYFLLLAGLGISTYAVREGSGLRNKQNNIDKFASELLSINILSMIFSYIIFFIVIIYSPKLNMYKNLLIIQSSIILFTTIGVEWIYSIYEDFFYITIRNFIFQIISLVMLFMFVKSSTDYYIYAMILVISNAGSNILNFIYSKKYCKLKFIINKSMLAHIKPIIIIFFTNIATMIYVNSDITMLGYFCNEYNVGIYTVSVKIYSILKSFISSIIIVTLPRLSFYIAQKMTKQYNELLTKILNTLTLIMLPIVVGVNILGNEIILIISGINYLQSITSLKILSFALIFSIYGWFITTSVFLTLKKEKYSLISTIIGSLTNVLLNILFISKFKENGAAITTLISEFIVFSVALYYMKKYISINSYKTNLINSLLGCISIIIVSKIIKSFISNIYIYTICIVICSIVVYYCVLLLLKNKIILELTNSIINKIKKEVNNG